MTSFSRDLRHAARALLRTPAFTLVAVLSLALGIGAQSAIFRIVDALMWRPLPVADPDRLVLVGTEDGPGFPYGEFEAMRDAPSGADLSAVAHTDRYNVVVAGHGIDEGPVRVALVSGNYFSSVGVTPSIGRALTGDDDRDAATPVAVVSDAYWISRFARATDVVGRTLTVTGVAYEIVGVTPPGFSGEWIGRPTDVWIPVAAVPRVITEIPVGLASTFVSVVGRLRAGVAAGQAQAALQVAHTNDLRQRAGANPQPRVLQAIANARVVVDPGARGYSPQRESFGRSLTVLLLAVGLMLLVACANLANLMLARADARRRDVSVRLALGASRAQIAQPILIESALVAAVAGVAGLFVARWSTAFAGAFMRTEQAGRGGLSLDLALATDGRLVAFTIAIAGAAAVFCGLIPAVRASRAPVAAMLGGRGADAGPRGAFRGGTLLVVSQVACSIVLLVGAGLFVRTLRNLSTEDLGFGRDRLLLVWTLPGQTGGRGAAAANFWQRVMTALTAVPGVVSAGASNQGVLNGAEAGPGGGPGLRIEGEPQRPAGVPGWRSFVTPDFFKTMGIPVVAGREFTEQDTAEAPRGVIVNEAFARHYFGARNPIGHRIWFPEDTNAPTEIIGLVKDSTGGTPREVHQRIQFTYFSYRDKEAARRLRSMTIAVRTAEAPLPVAARVRQALRALDPNLPVTRIDTVDEQLAGVLTQERLMATVSTFFGAVALALACLGLYGVVSYSVGRRTNEVGIRMALGATRGGVLALVLGESLWLVAAGIAIGLPVALAGTRLLAARLFGVGAADPLTIGAATALMVLVAAGAAAVPAGRAARVDPMIALRRE